MTTPATRNFEDDPRHGPIGSRFTDRSLPGQHLPAIFLAVLPAALLITGCGRNGSLPAAENSARLTAVASASPTPILASETQTKPAESTNDAAPGQSPESDVPAMPLRPFGTLEWSDTLGAAISKVRKLDGANKVELVLLHRRLPAKQFDGPGKIRQWLNGLFAETTTYHKQFQRQSPALPRPYYDVGSQIEAKSLSLVGVPFTLKVTFTNEPGLIMLDPERVRKQSAEFFGSEIPDDVPLVLSQVEMLPGGVVSPEAHREIIDTLMKKYGPLRVKNPAGDDLNQPYLNLTFRDSKDNQLDLYPGGRLLYRNGDVHREKGSLAERFRQHQHEHDEQQRKSRTKKQPNTLKDL